MLPFLIETVISDSLPNSLLNKKTFQRQLSAMSSLIFFHLGGLASHQGSFVLLLRIKGGFRNGICREEKGHFRLEDVFPVFALHEGPEGDCILLLLQLPPGGGLIIVLDILK